MNYFWLDASALVKRYVPETGTPVVNYLFSRVPLHQMICLLESVGEVISIFVRRRNTGAITITRFHQVKQVFRAEVSHCADVEKIYPTPGQITRSWELIELYSLNSTDSIILRCVLDKAIELRASGHNLVLVSADARLLKAAQAEGLLTFNPETDSQTALDAFIVTSP
ncbi:type II toxin-antitoxin system VapC family toxin [Candidatus Poribacteria bacterium]|nr:type II toxin-antitoxin system VapC family toxin [Candidatus Poribacteria bacterium]